MDWFRRFSRSSFRFLWPNHWQPAGGVAIVTGASSGIGRELTGLLVARGCHVIAVARRADRLDALAASVAGMAIDRGTGEIDRDSGDDLHRGSPNSRGRIFPVVGDVTDQRVRDAAFAIVDREFSGGLDLLVNNAGIGGIGLFEEADPSRMRQIMEVNFFAPTLWTRDALPRLRNRRDRVTATRSDPVICNIGSVLGHRAVPLKSEYCASKFALHGWSDSLRAELAGERIAVTLVSPSTTRSEFFDSLVGTPPNQTSKSFGSWPADRVARAALKAIIRRQDEVVLSGGGKALVFADRLAPTRMNRILALGKSRAMPRSDTNLPDANGPEAGSIRD